MPENPGDIEYRNDLFQFVMKASAQFYSIAFFFFLGSVKFKLFHSFPENGQLIPKTKPIYSNSRETENKRVRCRLEKKKRIWDLFVHVLVAKENGHLLPFWILSLQTIYYMTR